MKPLLLSFTLFLFALQLSAQFSWLEVQSSSVSEFDAVCTGPAGEVFASGYNGSPVVQRYDQNGNPGFFRALAGNGTSYDIGYDRTNDRLAVAGEVGGKPFLELIDPATGATISSTAINGAGLIKAIDVTATHIYAIGNYSGTLDFPGILSITGGSAFVIQFDLNGVPIRAINITAPLAKGFDVKVDAAGNVYFTVATQSDIFFGIGFPGNYTHNSDEEFVLVQADAALQAQYSTTVRRTISPVPFEVEIPLALDETQNIVYVGTPFNPSSPPLAPVEKTRTGRI